MPLGIEVSEKSRIETAVAPKLSENKDAESDSQVVYF